MSDLGFMERLLDGVEVEWKTLWEVVEFRRGAFPQPYGNSDWFGGEGSMPFVQVADVADEGFSLNKKTKQRISKLAQPKSVFVEEDTVIVSLQGTIGRVAITQYPCFVDRTLAIFTKYKQRINKKYFAYQLKSKFDLEKKYARGSTLKTITKEEFSKFQIPIPPINIQAEIVRILDTFTELTTELTTELNARKKQYNYYRDQLLSFEEGEVEWKPLGEVAIFRRGTAITKKQTTNGEIPVVANGPRPTYFHGAKNRDGETIVIARSGAYAGYVSFWNQPIFLTDAFSVHPDATVLKPKFAYYFLQNKQDQIHAMKKGAGVPHVRVKEFESFDIPIPSLIEQARIIATLDKFDILTNSITEGLPREIELRQKQYEYYRDKLLSFPKPEVAA